MKTLIATALAATIALTSSVTPAIANDREDEIGALLFGLATLAILGAAIENRNDNRPRAQVTVNPPRHPANPPRVQNPPRHPIDGLGIPPRARVLPAACLTHVQTRNGPVRMFGRRCLQNNYRFADRLPQNCGVFVEGPRHTRYGYRPRCLRNWGFSTTARR